MVFKLVIFFILILALIILVAQIEYTISQQSAFNKKKSSLTLTESTLYQKTRKLNELHAEYDKLLNNFTNLTQENNKLLSDFTSLQLRFKNEQELNAQARIEKDKLQNEYTNFRAEIDRITNQNVNQSELLAYISHIQSNLDDIKTNKYYNSSEFKEWLTKQAMSDPEIKNDIIRNKNNFVNIEKLLTALRASRNNLEENFNTLQSQYLALKNNFNFKKDQYDQTLKKQNELLTQISQLNTQLGQLKTLQIECELLKNQNAKLEKEIAECNAQLKNAVRKECLQNAENTNKFTDGDEELTAKSLLYQKFPQLESKSLNECLQFFKSNLIPKKLNSLRVDFNQQNITFKYLLNLSNKFKIYLFQF